MGDVAGVTVVDDYGHHPTEISVTLSAAADLGFKRVVCVFQPHRYSRTQALAREFGTCFDSADVLRVMDVFAAGEMPIPGISGKTVVESVRHTGNVLDVAYVPNRKKLVEELCTSEEEARAQAEAEAAADAGSAAAAGELAATAPAEEVAELEEDYVFDDQAVEDAEQLEEDGAAEAEQTGDLSSEDSPELSAEAAPAPKTDDWDMGDVPRPHLVR